MTNPVIGIASRMQTPKGLRLHIGLFGRRNAGKSSLINALTNQKIAIVSDVPGTTTDPVEKACELAPIGPVVFIDTAGIDDVGELGGLRTERSLAVLGWVDVALIVCDAKALTESELELIGTVKSTATPAVVVLNKADTADSQALTATENQVRELGYEPVTVCASQKQNIDAVREACQSSGSGFPLRSHTRPGPEVMRPMGWSGVPKRMRKSAARRSAASGAAVSRSL